MGPEEQNVPDRINTEPNHVINSFDRGAEIAFTRSRSQERQNRGDKPAVMKLDNVTDSAICLLTHLLAPRILEKRMSRTIFRTLTLLALCACFSPDYKASAQGATTSGLTGIVKDPRATPNPAVRGLFDRGLARVDPLCIGIETDRNCAIIGRDGAVSQRLFAVGPLTRAAFWEVIAIPDIRNSIAKTHAKIVGISPIVGGKAIKGPLDQMMESLGLEVSPFGVAQLYKGLIRGYVIDEVDRTISPKITSLGMRVIATKTVMDSDEARAKLAENTLKFAETIS